MKERKIKTKVSLPAQLYAAETDGKRELSESMRTHVPASWIREREFNVQPYDKAFACEWEDDNHILIGTKCNNLLRLNIHSGSFQSIPLPETPNRPDSMSPFTHEWGLCGIHSIAFNPARDLIATGGANPSDCLILRADDFTPIQTLVGHLDWLFGTAWLSSRHLVTGSRDGSVALWNVDYEPQYNNNSDNNSNSNVNGGVQQQQPVVTTQYKNYGDKADMKRKYRGKVRDLKYNYDLARLGVLSTEGCIKLQDPTVDLRVSRSMDLPGSRELVCMALSSEIAAAGCLNHVWLLDPRRRQADIMRLTHANQDQGTRSVSINGNLITFGTGRGIVAFFDIRNQQLVPTEPAPDPHVHSSYNWVDRAGVMHNSENCPAIAAAGGNPDILHYKMGLTKALTPQKLCLTTGKGYLVEDATYHELFYGEDIPNACYAHAWDPSGRRLFTCGGPLAFGLKGCYMGIWE